MQTRLRHPYDKRAYIAPMLALLCSLAVAIGSFYIAGLLRQAVPAGGFVPADGQTYAVEGVRYDEGRGVCTIEVLLEPDCAYTVAVVRSGAAPGSAEANGVALARADGRLASLRQVSTYTVPAALGSAPDAPRRVVLELETLGWVGADNVYIGTHDAIYDSFYLLEQGMKVCALTMLAVMVLYALSLFLAKRSETYLIPFVAYAAFLIVWIALVGTEWFNGLSTPVVNYVRICVHFYVAYIPSAICILLADVELPRALRPFLRWYGLLFVPALFAAAAYVGNFGAVMAAMTLICLVVAGWALVRGAALGHRGVIVLVAGFGITMDCKLGATLVDVGMIDDSVLMYALRKARLLNVPVVLSIMLYLNQTFARNFQKTEETNALLEAMVEHRTANLVKQQSMRLGMMVNIFHDLRSPLFAIRCCVDQLDAGSQELRAQSMAILKDRVAVLGRLIDDLFTAAKLEDGECLLAEDPVDLVPELYAVVDACTPLARERGVAIGLELESPEDGASDAASLATWGDRRYLARAFENLITNALCHAPQGSRVVVRARLVEETPGTPDAQGAGEPAACRPAVQIVVHNDGDPIDPQVLARLFERYYQRNQKAPDGSSGIGLSIVKTVVERHHGTVEAASSAAAGTDFTVTLPFFGSYRAGSNA